LCSALEEPRATYYRSQNTSARVVIPRISHRKLSETEEQIIMEEVNGERFGDLAPGEICAILLDEGRYLCSERTMYNILKKNQQTVIRRQSTPHVYKKPELLATRPNELWSWDITKLRGPSRWMWCLEDAFTATRIE
jgi:putative transposase